MVYVMIGIVSVIGTMWLGDVIKNGLKGSGNRLWKEFF